MKVAKKGKSRGRVPQNSIMRYIKQAEKAVQVGKAGYKLGTKLYGAYKSYKGTSTQTMNNALAGLNAHNDHSEHKQIILKRKPLKNKGTGKIHFQISRSFSSDCNEGRQAVYQLVELNKDMLNGPITDNCNTAGRWPVTLFDFDPNSKITSGQNPYNANLSLQNFTQIVNIERVNYKLELYNASSVAQTCYVYWFMTSKATDQTPLQLWTEDCTTEGFQKPLADSRLNFADPATTIGRANPFYYGQYPNTPSVRKFYKVLRVNKFVLQGGDSRKYQSIFHINRAIHEQTLNEMTNDPIPGVTIYPMIITRGSPVIASDNGQSAPTYSQVKLGVLTNVKYTFSFRREPPSVSANFVKVDYRVDGNANTTKIIDDEDTNVNPQYLF